MSPVRAYLAPSIRAIAITAVFGLAAASAHAGLILTPKGGFTVFKDGDGDDEVAHFELNEGFSFYGSGFTGIDISTNGNLNFSGNADFDNVALPDSNVGGMIAPLWDDFTLFQGSRIIAQQGDGWFGITWRNMATWFDLDERHTFQAIMFNQDRDFGGFSFQAGDIAFAYGPLGSSLNFDDLATVGVENGNGTKSTGLPGGGTTIDSADLGKLKPIKTEFILYRWNGTGYDASYQHTERAVPEPAALAALGIGLLALKRAKRKAK